MGARLRGLVVGRHDLATLTVGAGKDFSTLGGAIAASSAGDTILIDAGTYTNDFATISHALTIQGVGGLAHLVATTAPPNGKAILVISADVTIDHLEFSGVQVPDGNGAGIRYEGGALVVTNSWFHDNQDGILAGAVPGGTIVIDHSEFSGNGSGTGLTHALYVNGIDKLTVTNSLFRETAVGHHIKSRALETVITGNRLFDMDTGSASYLIDLPDGGAATVLDNVLQKGLLAENRSFIHLGGERVPSYDNTSLLVQGNLVINDMVSGPPTFVNNASDVGGANVAASVVDNTFHGVTSGQVLAGLGSVTGSLFPGGAAPALDLSHPFVTAAPCFRAGTRLATPSGLVAVEDLAPDDVVLTLFGGAMAVRWMGHRRLDCARHARPWDVMPVRVAAGALGEGLPCRDLWLSPDHALYLDGVLVPVRYLVNGATIVQEAVAEVTYFHVELQSADGLAAHGVVLAEGVAAESYLDTGNRGAFANGGGAVQAHADFAFGMWQRAGIAPLVLGGERLQAERRLVARRAEALGWRLVRSADLEVAVDGAVAGRLAGTGVVEIALPPGAREVVLRSRCFVPAQVMEGSGDHRRLGVAVSGLALDGMAIDLARLGAGWHEPEAALRWTDGAGRLGVAGARGLQVTVGMVGLYWEDGAVVPSEEGDSCQEALRRQV